MESLWPSRCAACGRLHQGLLCGDCRPGGVHHVPIRLAGIRTCLTMAGYASPLGRAVRVAKTHPSRVVAVALAECFAHGLGTVLDASSIDLIVAAPTPWTRRLTRGFHLAALLADQLSRQIEVPVVAALTSSPGPRQSARGAAARRRNLRGRVKSQHAAPGSVLLVDDVITTGATAAACARELLGDTTREVRLATLCAVRRPSVTSVQSL